MTVGMAFSYFAEQQIDIALIEVGLGGRLDSTNIIIPQVSLITNIGMDHTDILGDSLAKIAGEKAGIIKPNVPVVISETQKETKKVFEAVAAKNSSKIVFADQENQKIYRTDLKGNYQRKNSIGVLAVIKLLTDFKIKSGHITRGFKNVVANTGLLGRWQILGNAPKIICDTAHNKKGLKLVMQQLENEDYKGLHLVIGFVKGKALKEILAILPKNARYYFCSPKIERGLDVIYLKECAAEYGLKGDVYTSVKGAYSAAKKRAAAKDLIFVGGSTFVVAEVV